MSEWNPDLDTRIAIHGLIDTMLTEFRTLLGIDEIIPSCEVINMDPYATGTLPRYIRVRVNQYYQDVRYRGGLNLAAGDYVTVVHLIKGELYEVLGASGATTTSSVDAETIQGRAVQDHNPEDGEVLTWVDPNNQWEPQPPYGSEGGVLHLYAYDGWPSIASGCWGPAQTMFAGPNVNITTLDFDPSDIEYAEWTKRMPGDWNGGNLTFEVYWTAIDPGLYTYIGDDVQWNLQVNAYSDGELLDRAWGVAVEVSDLYQWTKALHVSPESGPVTPSGPLYVPAGGDILQFRLWRDAVNDNFPADAMVLGVTIYYDKS